MKSFLFFISLALFFNLSSATEKLMISNWLSAGPLKVDMPIFHDIPNVEGEEFSNSNLLTYDHLEINDLYPEKEKAFYWVDGKKSQWNEVFSDAQGYVSVEYEKDKDPQIVYLAAYIKADRWVSANLEIKSPNMLEAYLNGERIGTKKTTEDEEGKVGKVSKKLELKRGTHLLVIKSIHQYNEDGDNDSLPEWKCKAALEIGEPFHISDITTALVPEYIKDINHVLDGVKISGVSLSPDAKYYAVTYRRSLPPTDRSESWTEIKTLSGRELVHSFRNADISQLKWLPASNRLSFISKRNGKTSFFIHDLEKNVQEVLFEDIENFSAYQWSPDESYFVFYIREEAKEENTDAKKLLGPRDRIPGFRNRSFLYKYDIETNVKSRLTYGNLTTYLLDISPDGKKLLVGHTRYEYDEEPYLKQDVYMVDAESLKTDTLFYDNNWSVSLSFSPDGSHLLAVGGSSAFDSAGENIPEGLIPNNYDMQMYLIKLNDKSVKPITKDFDPSVNNAYWSRADNNIYFTVTEEDYSKLYYYDIKKDRFNRIETGVDIVSSFRLSLGSKHATFIGSLTNKPARAYHINLKNGKQNVIEDTESENYKYVKLGKTQDWNFTSRQGIDISGRVYLPPDFNKENKYPVIVYYYGGTSPVTRSFGGRYPFNLWAGNGYIVYVLQPSGSVGFGQEFSAAHVNNWGITVADEIIEGTTKFLEAHPYADADKVGCIGASYGGFMTMLLVTRTNMFEAAISHAGISSISSYWGEGYWGYSYSAVASSGSFPWNNKELYIEQSPLFHADKIETPLLLLSGDSDTNVPPGESIQMYTALTLLDKPVELVLIKGEDHHIVTYSKRIKWHETIMAWWDMKLKGQPEYWKSLFPDKNY